MGQCYLLLGPEKGLKEDFIKKIKSELGDYEVSKFYAFEDYEEEMFAQLLSEDLFAPHKLVILDEAQEIKTKDKAKAVAKYIQNPSESATFLVLSTELYIHADIMAAVPNQKDNILKFYELFENRKTEWLQNYFSRNGFSIEASACSAIVEKVDNNIQEFESVCSQMVVYFQTVAGKNTVTYSDVEDFLTHTRQETDFTLFSYIATGKLDSALECLQTLLHTNDASVLTAVVASRLANYFRRVYSILANIEKGLSIDDSLKTKYFATDRPVTMPKDKEIYKAACRRYSLTDVRRILVTLAEYDIKVKEQGTLLQQVVLEKCIVDIMTKKGKHSKQLDFAAI